MGFHTEHDKETVFFTIHFSLPGSIQVVIIKAQSCNAQNSFESTDNHNYIVAALLNTSYYIQSDDN